jgi:hypothetical protein
MTQTKYALVTAIGWVDGIALIHDPSVVPMTPEHAMVPAPDNVGVGWMHVDGIWLAPGGSRFLIPLTSPTTAQANARSMLDTLYRGVTLVSNGTPSFTGTYSMDAGQLGMLSNVADYYSKNGKLPGKQQVCFVTTSLTPVTVRNPTLVMDAYHAMQRYGKAMDDAMLTGNVADSLVTAWPSSTMELS